MERFLERHNGRVIGTLSGFDRILFRGTLRSLCYTDGLDRFLTAHRILYKNFGATVERFSNQIKQAAHELARQFDRPYQYLASSTVSKEDIAKQIMARDGVTKGLVCVLGCVEPCQSYTLHRDRQTKHLRLVPAQRKCLHLYFYFVDREFGLMHVRLESWIPFTIQVCVNGREYLARRMDRAGIRYEQRDNCFAWIENLPRAQAMLDDLIGRKWFRFLNALARRVNPLLRSDSGLDLRDYYWTVRQSEYATDVMFRSDEDLAAVYPGLVGHAIQQFRCRDVLRFLGRRTNARFSGEVTSDIQDRPEGVRIKHRVEENSIKMYDKQQRVLRIETTINNPRPFKVYREVTRKGHSCMGWVPMRKGLADMRRRAEIGRAATQRYLEALAVVGQPARTREVLDGVSERVVKQGRAYRPLHPISREETAMFEAMMRGEHLVRGFRNKDIREALGVESAGDPRCRRQASGQITRYLRLLRAHGLIRKVPRTQYYRITEKGHRVMTTARKLREIDVTFLAA
jgi:hypothetical protein